MKKYVLAAINSVQMFEGCEKEQVNLVTCATLYRRQGKYYISYEESELTGMEGTHTTIKLDGKTVLMMRTGRYASQMLFTEGERHIGVYPTEFGSMTISTHTSRIHSTMSDQGGVLELDYTVEIDHMLAGVHHFEMLVTPQQAAEGPKKKNTGE